MSEIKLPGGIRHIVICGDTHIGCKLALCHPDGAKLDDGGTYKPSRGQEFIWSKWKEFWEDFVPAATNGEPYVIVHNGDIIDGVHHRATTQWSQNLGDQMEMAVKILQPLVKKSGGQFFAVRGTSVHSGESGVDEETICKRIGAKPNDDGQYCRWELWLQLQGHLIHFLHHIGTVSSPAHEATAVNTEMVMELVEACRRGEKPPHCIVRSHRHCYIEVRKAMAHGLCTAVVAPAWQLRTPFCYRITGARLTAPELGGLVITASKKTGLYCQGYVRWPGRAKVEIV